MALQKKIQTFTSFPGKMFSSKDSKHYCNSGRSINSNIHQNEDKWKIRCQVLHNSKHKKKYLKIVVGFCFLSLDSCTAPSRTRTLPVSEKLKLVNHMILRIGKLLILVYLQYSTDLYYFEVSYSYPFFY